MQTRLSSKKAHSRKFLPTPVGGGAPLFLSVAAIWAHHQADGQGKVVGALQEGWRA